VDPVNSEQNADGSLPGEGGGASESEAPASDRPGRTGATLASEARAMVSGMAMFHRSDRVDTLRAMGMIVLVEPTEFVAIVAKMDRPMVILAEGALSMTFRYVTVYKEMIFFSKGDSPVTFVNEVELIRARKIWLPERGA